MRGEIAKIVFSPDRCTMRSLCCRIKKLQSGEMMPQYQKMITNAVDPEYFPPITMPELLAFEETIAIQVDKKLFTSRSSAF